MLMLHSPIFINPNDFRVLNPSLDPDSHIENCIQEFT